MLGSYFENNKPIRSITQRMMSYAVKRAVESLQLHHRGLDANSVSSHSLRAGGAMAMFLSGMSDTTIKKMGRWSSDTFLTYIHAQIAQFAKGISKRMATPFDFQNIAYQPIAAPKLLY